MAVKEIIVGTRFERLVVVSQAPSIGQRAMWECRCDCGTVVAIIGKSLHNGHTKSCGCFKRDTTSRVMFKHGLTRTVIGLAWKAIIQRCFNPVNPRFKRYGGRGIKPCEFIRCSPVNLLLLIGERPTPKHSVGRIDNNAGYFCGACPECVANKWTLNVRWEVPRQQVRNRSITKMLEVDGEVKPVGQWAEETGIDYGVFNGRLLHGRNPFKAAARGKLVTLNGQSKTIAEWSLETGIPDWLFRQRLVAGRDPFAKGRIGRPPQK